MAAESRSSLFRKRNFLGAALLAGIGLGVYLEKLNFGWGDGNQFGIANTGTGDGNDTQVSVAPVDVINKPAEAIKEADELPIAVPDVVRVLIDERQYYLRSEIGGGQDLLIALPKLIDIVSQAPGDEDGLRVRVYRRSTARASAEEKLKTAFAEAGINDAAIFWVPTPVK